MVELSLPEDNAALDVRMQVHHAGCSDSLGLCTPAPKRNIAPTWLGQHHLNVGAPSLFVLSQAACDEEAVAFGGDKTKGPEERSKREDTALSGYLLQTVIIKVIFYECFGQGADDL